MTEIESLKEQIRLLQRQIKELEEDGVYTVGRARLSKGINYGRCWNLAYESRLHNVGDTYPHKPIWRNLGISKSRREVIDEIPHVIKAMQELYEKVKGLKDDEA